ncbi:hypothetical protein EMPS_09884 [Entomortierella parvispora]|uniref:Reverse transcriptase RNase H-like domain-containing protein n=1 Tax=Entomortierella parvispora TaxID=205924 RepID=A0A9P3HJ43_9FUNG|nr:hypothetical protein EMPS_09884 [Entomortierella parvispora]
MQSTERNYPTHEQELLAVIHALRTWCYYLDVIVNTDHATLRHFPSQPKLTRRQAGWMELPQEYDFDFKYSTSEELTISCPTPSLADPDYRDLDPVELHYPSLSLSSDARDQLVQDYENDPRLGPICKDA